MIINKIQKVFPVMRDDRIFIECLSKLVFFMLYGVVTVVWMLFPNFHTEWKENIILYTTNLCTVFVRLFSSSFNFDNFFSIMLRFQ